jgi:hypothetical protein
VSYSSGTLQAYAVTQAQYYGVPQQLFLDVISAESSWNPRAYNPLYGAAGIAQFIPDTAKQYGVDVYNPYSSLTGAARYLSDLYGKTGNWQQALLCYSGSTLGCKGDLSIQPYPGRTAIANDLAQIQGQGGTTATAGGTGGTWDQAAAQALQTIANDVTYATGDPNPQNANPNSGGISADAAASGCLTWLGTPFACIGYSIRALGFVVLAIVVLAVGGYMLAQKDA